MKKLKYIPIVFLGIILLVPGSFGGAFTPNHWLRSSLVLIIYLISVIILYKDFECLQKTKSKSITFIKLLSVSVILVSTFFALTVLLSSIHDQIAPKLTFSLLAILPIMTERLKEKHLTKRYL